MQYIHVLIARTYKYFTFHSKTDFSDVMIVKDPEMEILSFENYF